MRTTLTLIPFMLVAACGGAGSVTFESLKSEADAMESNARRLGIDTPCNSAQQCGLLVFNSPLPTCTPTTYKPYSLVSATASQAENAAAEQRKLAEQALQISPLPPRPCPPIQLPEPRAVCTNNVCSSAP